MIEIQRKTVMKKFITLIFAITLCMTGVKAQTMDIDEISSRMQLKELVDRYAVESDKGNQDYYKEIFLPDVKVNVYNGETLTSTFNKVDDMIAAYKQGGKAVASFHMNGQQVVEFQDTDHATGICYCLANLVNPDKEGKNQLTTLAVRYYDTYVRINGRWWISQREQKFVFTASPTLLMP